MQSISEKLTVAEEYKNKANDLFREGDYRKARASYGRALAYCKCLPGSARAQQGIPSFIGSGKDLNAGKPPDQVATPAQDDVALDLEKTVMQNLAICYLKLDDPKAALDMCNQVLAYDEHAWKAKLRKGQAYMAMNNLDGAQAILTEALGDAVTEEQQKPIKTELLLLKKRFKAFDKEQSKLFAGKL
jgi:tetratricopeptide (TPR) repeat protein